MFNIIRGNFKISKQQIAELKKEINELRQSIEHTENLLEDKVARVKGNLRHIGNRVQQMYEYQHNPVFIEDKLIDLEDRLRRKHLRVDGTKERPNETWEYCKKELHTHFKESLGFEEKGLIERVHRVKTDKNKKGSTPRTIAYRILNYKD